jgi:hypothetical protein
MSRTGIIVTTGISGERKSPQVIRTSKRSELLAEGALRSISDQGWFPDAPVERWLCENRAVLPSVNRSATESVSD